MSGRDAAEVPEVTIFDQTLLDWAVEKGDIDSDQKRAILRSLAGSKTVTLDGAMLQAGIETERLEVLAREAASQVVPGYEILGRLGAGGMGIVFKARQVRLDRIVALKVVTPAHLGDQSYILRFEREAQVVARLNHPNIVAAYDYGEVNGRVYLALEFVDGLSCHEAIERYGSFPEELALGAVRGAVLGLSHALSHGIIHRDIKPANLLISNVVAQDAAGGIAGGVVKVADLGLATVVHEAEQGRTQVTMAGGIVGSPHYMSLEQARGENVDFRTDIYALGATLYHMITGTLPFAASSIVGVLSKKECERLEHPQDAIDGLSDGLVRILDRMLARDRESRYGSYEELLADLDLLAAGARPQTPPVPPAGSSLDERKGAKPKRSRSNGIPIASLGASTRRRARPARARGPRAAVIMGAALGAALLAAGAWRAFWGKEPADPGRRDPEGAAAPAERSPAESARSSLASLRSLEGNALVERLLSHGEPLRRDIEALPETESLPLRIEYDALVDRALEAHGETSLPALEERYRSLDYEGLRAGAGEAARRYELLGRPGHVPPRLAELERLAAAALDGGAGEAERGVWRAAEATHDPIARLDLFEGFESKFPFSPRLAAVAEERARADSMAPVLEVSSDPTGARCLVDGAEVGTTPWRGRIPAGEHRLEIVAEGFLPEGRTIDHRAGIEVALRLDPAPASPLSAQGVESRPLWTGSLQPWSLQGEWAGLESEAGLASEVAPPRSWNVAARDLSATFGRPPFSEAPGWALEWQMGCGPEAASEAWLLPSSGDDQVAVVGLRGDRAYVGLRGPEPERALRILAEIPAPERVEGMALFRAEWHGDVLVAFAGTRRIGSLRPDWPSPPPRFGFAVAGEGHGRFRDFQLYPMR